MNWWKINGILMLISSSIFCQIPVDTSYTLTSAVEKISKRYPDKKIEGVRCTFPESVIRLSQYYKVIGERKLIGHLFVPKANEQRVGVLLIHGGGWRTGSPELMFPIAEQLALAGYSVLVPEYRLSLEAQYPAAVQDLSDALEWLKSNEKSCKIDSSKLAVIGCSAGGQLAALLGTTNPVQAIVDIDGVLAFKHPDSKEGSMAAQWLGGTFEESPNIWMDASALTHVNEMTPPTLFLASKYPRFLAGHKEYMQVLKEAGTFTEIKFLEDAPHSFWLLSPWFDETIEHTLNFLNKIFTE